MSQDGETCINHIASYGERSSVFGRNTWGGAETCQEALSEFDFQEEWAGQLQAQLMLCLEYSSLVELTSLRHDSRH